MPETGTISSARGFVGVVLGTLAIVALGSMFIAWDGTTTEEQLAHELGDDTAVLQGRRRRVESPPWCWAGCLTTWRWPAMKKRWCAERETLRESRESHA